MRCECGKRIEFNLEFALHEAIPVAFHPYTSSVKKRVFNLRGNNDYYREVKKYLVEKFNEAGISAYSDNKTVFECRLYGQKICFGFYDWTFSVGFDYQDSNKM